MPTYISNLEYIDDDRLSTGKLSMASQLCHDVHVFDTALRPVLGKPWRMAAKRYYVSRDSQRQEGITLLLFHANGAHKEHWEPFLETLLSLQPTSGRYLQQELIREAWAFDHFTHGDSAVENAEALDQCDTDKGPTVCDWGEAVADFANANLRSHKLVLIGHSGGTCAQMYFAKRFTQFTSPNATLKSLVLIEPPIAQRHVFEQHVQERKAQVALVAKVLGAQKEEWPSREAAYEVFKKRQPWKSWDDRMRRVQVQHGLRLVNNGTSTAVTTKRVKRFEIASFAWFEPSLGSFDQINAMKGFIPIHAIFAKHSEVVPKYVQECFEEAKKKGDVASIEHMPGYGHWIVQMAPDEVARTVHKWIGPSTIKAAL